MAKDARGGAGTDEREADVVEVLREAAKWGSFQGSRCRRAHDGPPVANYGQVLYRIGENGAEACYRWSEDSAKEQCSQ